MRIQGYGLDPAAVWRKQLESRAASPLSQASGPAARSATPGARSVGALSPLTEPSRSAAGAATEGPSFGDLLHKAVGMDGQADKAVQSFVRGETPLHETMVSLAKADIGLRLLVNVRNKLLDAYREVMRMS